MASRAELVGALKSFSKEELLSNVVPDIGFLDWNKIKRAIINKKLSMTKGAIINQIADQLLHLEDKDKTEILEQLYILGLILHSSRYKWKAIQLLGGEQKYMSSHELKSSIKSQLLREGTRGEIVVRLKAELQWIRIVEKKLVRGRGIVSQRPACAVVAAGQSYMFVHSSGLKEHILMCIVRALGREGIKNCKLMGKDIKSLLRLLRAKEARASNSYTVNREPEYQEKPSRSVEGVDFTQNKNRHNYCTKIFNNDENEMPQLEEMILQVEGTGWNVEHLVPEMVGKPFSFEVKFQSSNIAQMFTEMAALGAFSTPLPEYARKLPTLGKNILQLRPQKH